MANTNGTVRRLLTVAEVAEELRITRVTALSPDLDRKPPAIRIGGTPQYE
jgi:hypothetical protein